MTPGLNNPKCEAKFLCIPGVGKVEIAESSTNKTNAVPPIHKTASVREGGLCHEGLLLLLT